MRLFIFGGMSLLENLPDNVLEKIFGYLNIRDLRNNICNYSERFKELCYSVWFCVSTLDVMIIPGDNIWKYSDEAELIIPVSELQSFSDFLSNLVELQRIKIHTNCVSERRIDWRKEFQLNRFRNLRCLIMSTETIFPIIMLPVSLECVTLMAFRFNSQLSSSLCHLLINVAQNCPLLENITVAKIFARKILNGFDNLLRLRHETIRIVRMSSTDSSALSYHSLSICKNLEALLISDDCNAFFPFCMTEDMLQIDLYRKLLFLSIQGSYIWSELRSNIFNGQANYSIRVLCLNIFTSGGYVFLDSVLTSVPNLLILYIHSGNLKVDLVKVVRNCKCLKEFALFDPYFYFTTEEDLRKLVHFKLEVNSFELFLDDEELSKKCPEFVSSQKSNYKPLQAFRLSGLYSPGVVKCFAATVNHLKNYINCNDM